MAIQEIPSFPQLVVSEQQGILGTRRWVLAHNDNLAAFLDNLSQSHWPGIPDCVPTQIQSGPFWENTNIKREASNPRFLETLGELPTYGAVLVVASYALHRITNAWPFKFHKPFHPPGTTLTLKVRGGGQMILVTPAGMERVVSPAMDCPEQATVVASNPGMIGRVIVPVAEYHLACDRMTRHQVDDACEYWSPGGSAKDWDRLNGCVNATPFLGAPAGTLLFDGYEIDETYVCDLVEPLRYRMTACFRCRIISDKNGVAKQVGGETVGWNHDFVNLGTTSVEGKKAWGWWKIRLRNESGGCDDRYPAAEFKDLFGNSSISDSGDAGSTSINDCEFCQASDPAPAASESIPSSGYDPYPSDSGDESLPDYSWTPPSDSALGDCADA